jgi:hypothetical protein
MPMPDDIAPQKPMKERDPFASVFFSVKECCEALGVLEEIHQLHSAMLKNSRSPDPLPVRREHVHVLVGMVRDSFCVRLANLFDKRRDVHSLKKYFKADEIDRLQKDPITSACIDARNKNICHLGKEYTKWPEVEAIVSSELKDLLERIKNGLMLARNPQSQA